MRQAPMTLALIALVVAGGCATREVVTPIYDSRGIQVELRGQVKNGEPVDRGLKQPATISVRRMTNILTAIEYKVDKEDDSFFAINVPFMGDSDDEDPSQYLNSIVTAETIVPIAKAVSKALAQADSSQVVVVKAVRKQRRLGIFHRKFYTGFTVYVEGNYLYLHLSHLNREIENDPNAKVPDPVIGETSSEFRAVPNSTMHAVGPYGLAIRWRDPFFAKTARSLEGKDVRTRTILMESETPEDELGASLPIRLSDQLSPATLRALADLEEERRDGKINETQYRMRRDDLMTGEAPKE